MAGEGQVIGCHSIEQWTEEIKKANESNKLVVIDFTASWCGPCRLMNPIIAELSKKMPNIIFLKVDVDELETVAEEWKVEAMPTLIMLKEGKMIDKIVGANKHELLSKINKHSADSPATSKI
jgi:thioredoxin 1